MQEPQGVLTRTLSRTYDARNRLLETVGGAGQTTTFAYDENGNPTAVTLDPAGLNQATTQAFDGLNRLRESADPDQGLTSYTYDARDNLTGVTDPNGLTTTYTYDGLDDLLSQTSPDTGSATFVHDAAGNRIRMTDALGVIVNYEYDALNRLTRIDYPTQTDVVFTYDETGEGQHGVGRLTTLSDAAGTTRYAYDLRGNVVRKELLLDGLSYILDYAYDAAGQLAALTYPSGTQVSYTREATGRIAGATVTIAGQTYPIVANVRYAPFGPVTGWAYGNGLSRTLTLDGAYRVTGLLDDSPTGTVLDWTLAYDAADNVTQLLDHQNSLHTQTLSYDARSQVVGALNGWGQNQTYAYDRGKPGQIY